jgi:hypothetical protein
MHGCPLYCASGPLSYFVQQVSLLVVDWIQRIGSVGSVGFGKIGRDIIRVRVRGVVGCVVGWYEVVVEKSEGRGGVEIHSKYRK